MAATLWPIQFKKLLVYYLLKLRFILSNSAIQLVYIHLILSCIYVIHGMQSGVNASVRYVVKLEKSEIFLLNICTCQRSNRILTACSEVYQISDSLFEFSYSCSIGFTPTRLWRRGCNLWLLCRPLHALEFILSEFIPIVVMRKYTQHMDILLLLDGFRKRLAIATL